MIIFDAFLFFCFLKLYIPYTICDLFDIGGEFKTNLHLLDIFNSSEGVNLDMMLTTKFEFTVLYKREILLLIFKRIALSLAAGISEGNITPKIDAITGQESAYVDKWLHIRPLFQYCVDVVKHMSSVIAGTKKTSFSFSFSTVSEFLGKMTATNAWLRSILPPDIGSVPGYIPKLYKKLVGVFNLDVSNLLVAVENHMHEKQLREKNEKTISFINMVATDKNDNDQEGGGGGGNASSNLDVKLKNLGLDELTTDDLINQVTDEENSSPETYMFAETDMQYNYDARAIECYQNVWDVTLGTELF